MRRSNVSPSARSIKQSINREKAFSPGSSPPFYGSWASSVDYIKSLQTLSVRLDSMELPKVADQYAQKLVFDGVPIGFYDQANQNVEKESKKSIGSTLVATEHLAHAISGNSLQNRHKAGRKIPRSPYDSNDGPKTTIERHRSSPEPLCLVNHSNLPSACDNSGGDIFLKQTNEDQEFSTYELELDSVDLGCGSKSGSRPSSSNFSRNFSASECSMFYSPSRCSGLSSSTNQSTVSHFKLPSVCMMSNYSAENFQNRKLDASSRLRRLKHTDYDLAKSHRELFIAKNGANRSCMLASQKQHSNLRSACPTGTIISKDDLAKYKRLRNCDPNLASRELVRECLVLGFLI
jgi:hypothetical protein